MDIINNIGFITQWYSIVYEQSSGVVLKIEIVVCLEEYLTKNCVKIRNKNKVSIP